MLLAHAKPGNNSYKLRNEIRQILYLLSDCKGTRTYNYFVRIWTLHHLAKLAEWLSCAMSTYLDGASDCMILSCHVRVS